MTILLWFKQTACVLYLHLWIVTCNKKGYSVLPWIKQACIYCGLTITSWPDSWWTIHNSYNWPCKLILECYRITRLKNCLQQPNFLGNYLWLKCIKNLLHLNYLSLLASRSDSSNVKMSPSRTGPFTLRMMDRFVSSRNSTRTWKVQQLSFTFHPGHFPGSKLIRNKSTHNMPSS